VTYVCAIGGVATIVCVMASFVLLALLLHPCMSLRLEPGRIKTVPLAPFAAVRPRPLQHIQVPAQSGEATGPRIPRAVVLPCPPQRL